MTEFFQIVDLIPYIHEDVADMIQQRPPWEDMGKMVDSIRSSSNQEKEELRKLHEDDPHVEFMQTPEQWGNVPVVIIRPDVDPKVRHVLVWFHGGGLVAGHYMMDYFFAKHIVNATGCIFVGVEYRLAPENPYPAGVEDGYNVLQWLAGPDNPVVFSPEKIAVGGLSGGGPFATGTVLRANKGKGPKVCFLFLHTAMLDHRSCSESINFSMDPRIWWRDTNRKAWDLYLSSLKGCSVPGEASPMVEVDFSNYPPTYLSVGDVDLFRDEAIEFALNLTRAGVPVELHMLPRSPHGGDVMCPEGSELKTRMRNEYSRALRDGFNTD